MKRPLASAPPATAAEDEARLRQVLGYQLAQAAILTTGVFDAIVRSRIDLRPVEYTILMSIRENPGISPATLAAWLQVTRPKVSMYVDKLERRGLVIRERSASDGRRQHLHPSEQGAMLGAKLTRELVDAERTACASLTAVEQAMLTELLDKLDRSRRAAVLPDLAAD